MTEKKVFKFPQCLYLSYHMDMTFIVKYSVSMNIKKNQSIF